MLYLIGDQNRNIAACAMLRKGKGKVNQTQCNQNKQINMRDTSE